MASADPPIPRMQRVVGRWVGGGQSMAPLSYYQVVSMGTVEVSSLWTCLLVFVVIVLLALNILLCACCGGKEKKPELPSPARPSEAKGESEVKHVEHAKPSATDPQSDRSVIISTDPQASPGPAQIDLDDLDIVSTCLFILYIEWEFFLCRCLSDALALLCCWGKDGW